MVKAKTEAERIADFRDQTDPSDEVDELGQSEVDAILALSLAVFTPDLQHVDVTVGGLRRRRLWLSCR
jgi:hypothetical protein